MGFSFDVSVSALTVFFQGLLSFFSPCVLPLIPIYIGYLSGGTGKIGEDGKIHFKRSKVMVHTLCFVLGVSFAFFLLGLGFSAVGTFLKDNQIWFAAYWLLYLVCINWDFWEKVIFLEKREGFLFGWIYLPCHR